MGPTRAREKIDSASAGSFVDVGLLAMDQDRRDSADWQLVIHY